MWSLTSSHIPKVNSSGIWLHWFSLTLTPLLLNQAQPQFVTEKMLLLVYNSYDVSKLYTTAFSFHPLINISADAERQLATYIISKEEEAVIASAEDLDVTHCFPEDARYISENRTHTY